MMQYKGYRGQAEYDDEAKILHGEVLGLRDVVTFQAESVSDLEKAFRESVNDYLAFCKQRGEEPQKPLSGQFLLRMGSDQHRRLTENAQQRKVSPNSLVVEFLKQALDKQSTGRSTKRNGRSKRQAV